ncbi:MAG: aspartate kinase [Bdellovibrionota bacterium]|jgi:aspartate kinase
MIIMKFGGSSLRDATRINEVISLIREYLNEHPIIVCSALGSTTNNLLEAGQGALSGDVTIEKIKSDHLKIITDLNLSQEEITPLFTELTDLLQGIAVLQKLTKKTTDALMSFGERLSVRIIAAALSKNGIAAKPFDAFDLGFLTDSKFNNAEILPETYTNLRKNCAAFSDYHYTPIVTGFIAKDQEGNITTLGRSGSDLTASTLGAALNVREVQVWKDVDGLLTTDPRIVKAARPVGDVSFEEASELAYFGAKVLHPLAIQPAMAYNIPVRVKNSYNKNHPGTLITAKREAPVALLKALTTKRNVTLIDLFSSQMLGQYGFLARVFQIFDEHKISVDMVATSEVSVSLTLDKNFELKTAVHDLQQIASVHVGYDKAIISLIGDISRSSEILHLAFGTLHAIGINVQMISLGASKVNIGLIVEDSQAEDCIKELHKVFFETENEAA